MWLSEWRRVEEVARASHAMVLEIEPEPAPTRLELAEQIDVLHWFRFMLDLDLG